MAQLPGGQFDHSQYQDMRDFTPVPPGSYVAKIMDSEMKDTNDKSGQYLLINFEIVAGPYSGKGFQTRLNLVNANPTAVKIANEELATLTRACNLGPIQDSNQLHNIAHIAKLKLVPGDGKYGPKNEVVTYSSAQGMTEPPVNPEPDQATLDIINGVTTTGGDAPSAPATATSVPAAPEGFAAPQAAAAPTPPAQAQETAAPATPTAPAAPAPTEAPATAPAAAATAPANGAPPW